MKAPAAIIEAERQALRVLCQGTLTGAALETAIRLLATYDFREPGHRVVFEIVSALPSRDPAMIREHLGARLTNRGFPDFDFREFLAPHGLTSAQALLLIERLSSGAF